MPRRGWLSKRTSMPFAVYQGQWNVLERSFERDIIPMARSEGLALAPWATLAGGRIRTDAEEERRRESGEGGGTVLRSDWERNEEERKVSRVLEEVGKEVGVEGVTAGGLLSLIYCKIDLSCDGS